MGAVPPRERERRQPSPCRRRNNKDQRLLRPRRSLGAAVVGRGARQRHDTPGSGVLPAQPCRSCRGKHPSLIAVWLPNPFDAAVGPVLLFEISVMSRFHQPPTIKWPITRFLENGRQDSL